MADIEVVIKIPEEVYEQFRKDQKEKYVSAMISTDIIANAIQLPKGHGRLIDADETLKRIADKSKKSDNLDVINGLCGATAIIYDMLIESGQESEYKE